jgi:predicted dehydrogenase
MKMDIKIGIVGCGKIGKLRRDVIEESGLGRVVALCDPFVDFSDVRGRYSIAREYQELLGQDINTVFIASPNNVTSDICVASLDAGKHVFCEKPPGRNLREVLEIHKAYQRNPGLKLMFGFNHRYHKSVMSAYNLVKSGRMGKLMWGRGLYGKSGGNNFEKEWRSSKEISGGGILLDQGIHMIDLFNLFFGGFNDVKGFVSNTFWDIPVEDNAFILLKNDKNQYATFHSSSTHWKHIFKLDLFLTEGYIIISGFLTSTRSYGRETMITARRQFEDELELVGNPIEEKTYFDEDLSWELEVKEFLDAIAQNREIKSSSIDDAINAMEVVEKVYESDSSSRMKN